MDENRENPGREERDATLDDERAANAPDAREEMDEDTLQDALLEDSSLNAFQKKCAKIRDDAWMKIQIAVGIVLGAAAAVALFWSNLSGDAEASGSMFSLPLVIALVIALVVPNIIEKQTARKIPKGRVAMAATLGVAVVAFFIAAGLANGFKLTK